MITLNDQYLVALGKVVVNFSHLRNCYEHILIQSHVWTVEEGMKKFPDLTFRNLIKKTSNLMAVKFQSEPIILEEMNVIKDKAIIANEKRNDMLHSEWLENSALEYMMKYDKKEGKIIPCKPEDILKVAVDLWEVSILIIRFITNHFEPAMGRRYGIYRS